MFGIGFLTSKKPVRVPYQMTSLNHVFNKSSSFLSGNNHALPQYPPNPFNFLSIRRVYFHSNAANQSAKPPCLGSHFVSHGKPARRHHRVSNDRVMMVKGTCVDWPRSARVSSTHARSISPVGISCSVFTDSRALLRMCEITAKLLHKPEMPR